MSKSTFSSDEGIWLKGNLHGHSTFSDGELSLWFSSFKTTGSPIRE
ncbi:hypothetical protein [Sphaerochaeta sp. PS]|nr:hypothetical protein [Sphaerochaeta sp. PS]MDT4761053.1 hypothetical protein [Sphaerochaeta sp. PS]